MERHLELDLRELFGRLADPVQERQPARVGAELVKKVLRHDVPEAGVAILDRLVEPFERVVGLADLVDTEWLKLRRSAQARASGNARQFLATIESATPENEPDPICHVTLREHIGQGASVKETGSESFSGSHVGAHGSAHRSENDSDLVAPRISLPLLAAGVYGDAAAKSKALAAIEEFVATKPKVLPEFADFARHIGWTALWDKYGAPDACRRVASGDYDCGVESAGKR